MKEIRKIKALLKKGKLSSLFIILIAIFALYMTINTSVRIFDQYYSYRVLKNSRLNGSNTYIYGLYAHEGLMIQGLDVMRQSAYDTIDTIKNSEIVDKVYTIRYTDTFMYQDLYFGIILYDDDFLEAFPMLRKYGIDFSKNPDGVILSHKVFDDLNTGDLFEMTSITNGKTIPLTCAGHMKYPYKYISLNGISSDMYADVVFDNDTIMIMRVDDDTIGFLEGYTSIDYKTGAIFTVKKDASEEQINILLRQINSNGFVERLNNILSRSKRIIDENIKTYMLLPMFLVFASVFSYASITIVNVFKIQRDMAISYLCGASKRQLFITLLSSCAVLCAVPCILTTLYIIYAPQFQKTGDNLGVIPENAIIIDQIWIVVAFFILTIIVSFATTLFSMGRKSPLAYLRGLE